MLLAILLLLGCRNEKLPADVAADNPNLISVVRLPGDTSLLELAQYLPLLCEADSVTSATLRIAPADNDGTVFRIACGSGAPAMNVIDVWRDGKKTAVFARHPRAVNSPDYYVTSTGTSGRTIDFAANFEPEAAIVMIQNVTLSPSAVTIRSKEVVVKIPAWAADMPESSLRLYAFAGDRLSNDVLIPLQNGVPVADSRSLPRQDKHTYIIYSLMVDRFCNGDSGNDRRIDSPEVLPKVDYYGGDIAGITQKIKEGFFSELGVNTIWISPITLNPPGAWGQSEHPKTKFSGYHGYWPLNLTVPDPRYGTPEQIREMLEEAHGRNLNVILDYVSHHVHIDNPLMQEHPDWITPMILPDGRRNLELWDEQRLTTWFDTHLPTLDLGRKEVYEPMVDSALYWIAHYDFDGFRHDASKHVPEIFWQTLTRRMRERFPERSVYQIGETYGSPQLIGSYVKSGMLDAQFDFNVYDAAIRNIGRRDGDLCKLYNTLTESLRTYGYHNLMGYITGNHDRPRFISLADGAVSWDENSKAAGWNRDITIRDTVGYRKLALLEAFMMTLPGIPCIYQGDDYGVPGANDPDNRRMMQFGDYNVHESALRAKLEKLTALRRCNMVFLYGDLVPLHADSTVIVFARSYMGKTAVTALNNMDEVRRLTVTLPANLDPAGLKAHFGHTVTISGSDVTFDLSAVGYEIATN